jgi:hypothetical protein
MRFGSLCSADVGELPPILRRVVAGKLPSDDAPKKAQLASWPAPRFGLARGFTYIALTFQKRFLVLREKFGEGPILPSHKTAVLQDQN